MKRNKFSLSNYRLFSCRMGSLYPCGAFEVIPGDSVQQATTALVRCSPLLAPVMHPIDVRVHHWFVPYRILWDDFEDFITGGPDGDDQSVYPTLTPTVAVGDLADYLGIPPGTTTEVSALPFRAYALIFNEHYRDQDLVDPLVIETTSGPDSTTNTLLQRIAWEKDYFTSSRPWEQKGPAVTIPLTGSAPVQVGDGQQTGATQTLGVKTGDGLSRISTGSTWAQTSGADDASATFALSADLTDVSAVTVNALREALALQRYAENRARYGSRYVEYLRYLGVRSSDARLQRPEYLGGGRNTIQFSEILQTAEGTNPVGELRGHGLSAMRSRRYRRYFEEHGIVLSLMSIRPKTMYRESLHRLWSRRIKEDFWQKELQHIGQQEVFNSEVYSTHTDPKGTFGFVDRYDEYRRQPSNVAGEFRTSVLDYWHFARSFASDPALNQTFTDCTPTEVPFAASTNDTLYVMARHSVQARRMVAKVGTSFTY